MIYLKILLHFHFLYRKGKFYFQSHKFSLFRISQNLLELVFCIVIINFEFFFNILIILYFIQYNFLLVQNYLKFLPK
jgi:hypothetical protein